MSNEPISDFPGAKFIILWLFEVEISENTILRRRGAKFKERVRRDIFRLGLCPCEKFQNGVGGTTRELCAINANS